ncbi:Conserved_hypothetical protein [Hexamita inflata]|uniref:Uncharacterized protein n=1 Tax=Hexamita inflata TaxID=28002 RepID=A0AA86NRW2_9EUKA|nr:Conserved hypothetical protein [Hexamita inflata]
MADSSKEQILRNAARLLSFTTQVCTDKGKANLVTIFKDDIIRLTCEEKKLCSLLRLYNTFHDFEPMVLVHLNEFLPLDLRYDITHDPLNVELPPILVEHMATCPELHMAPEEDQYDVFLAALNQIVSQPIAEQFKLLLSRFVKGQPETRIEVLQFIIKSAELLGDFPELLAGLLEYLNKTWYNYAVDTMKFASVQQIAMAYGVFAENVPNLDMFRRIVECIKQNKLIDTQLKWRTNLILNIKNQTKQMLTMCNTLMDQLKNQKPNQFEPKKIDGRTRKPIVSQQRPNYQQIQYQVSNQQSDTYKNHLSELKAIIDPQDDSVEASFDVMVGHLAEFFNCKAQYSQMLDLKIPINYNLVLEVFKKINGKEMGKKICLLAETLMESPHSSIWQEAALSMLGGQNKATIQYLELDDVLELQRALTFNGEARYITEFLKKGVTFKQLQPLLTSTFNNLVFCRYQDLLDEKVISQRQLIENVIFYNSHADDNYGSDAYKPLSYVDENKVQTEYLILDQNGNVCRPLNQQSQAFTPFEKKLNNMSLFQKHKYYRKFQAEIDQTCSNSYKFQHPLRTRFYDKNNALNRQYYNAFANGHENTSALGLNPYNVSNFDQDIEKLFNEIEDANQLEEHLMRYDIYINNLKLTQLLLKAFCEEQKPSQLQLPPNCQVLLKAVISEEYFQQLQLYPSIAAPMVLERVNTHLIEMQKWRELVCGPMFSKRVNQIYFNNLDFQSRNLIEIDKKLVQCKLFQSELTARKATASLLQKKDIKPLNEEKVQYPWETDSFGLPKQYVQNQFGFQKQSDFYQNLALKASAPGCSCLYHASDEQIEFENDEQEQTNVKEIEKFVEKSQLFNRGFSLASQNSKQNKQHYCSDVHHLMIPVNQINQEAISFIKSQLSNNDTIRGKLFDNLMSLVTSGYPKLIDQSIYNFIRFLVIILDRSTLLYNISQNHLEIKNYSQLVFTQNEFDKEELTSAFDQAMLKRSLFQQIDDIWAPEDIKTQKGANDWETMQNMLLSQKPYSDVELLAIFGSQAYIGLSFKMLLRTIKRMFDDLFEGYQRIDDLINGRESIQTLMQQQTFSGFLIRIQMDDGVKTVLKSKKKYYMPLEVENVFRQAASVLNAQTIIVERIEDMLCFSEIDF